MQELFNLSNAINGEMLMSNQDQEFIMKACKHARALWDAIEYATGEGQAIWNTQDYGNTLENGTGQFEGITKAEIGPFLFAAGDAMKAVLDGGQEANIVKLLF